MMIRRFFFAALLFCLPLFSNAQADDILGSQDHPLISRYPGSVITEYSAQYDQYTLPLGNLQSGHLAKSQSVEGNLTHIHYEIPEGRSTVEVMRNYQQALQRAGFAVLFTCAGEQCGTGDVGGKNGFWCGGCSARHLSGKLLRPEGDVYVSLHVEQDNPNVKAWAQLDVIEMKPMEAGLVTVNAAALAGDITRSGHVAVYGIYFDTGKAEVKPASDAVLKEIAKLLQVNSTLKLHIVGHTDSVGQFASNMDLSRRRGEAVMQVLTTKYSIATARLDAQGVGPLAPVASNDSEEGRSKNRRVELVKQ